MYQVAVAYSAIAAGIIGTTAEGFPELWEAVSTPVAVLLLFGLPVALIITWFSQSEAGDREAALPVGNTVQAAQKSIAVLPFDNLSPDPNDAFFSDGLTEEVIADLSISRSLRVISRSSVMALKGTRKSLPEIGRELGVQFVLEGSVRKSGNNLRITAQLIEAETDHHLWAEKYDGVLDDVFAIQETVSRSIVASLRLTLNPSEEEGFSRRRIPDVRAYELAMRARHGLYSFRKEEMEEAQRHLSQALEIAGENAHLFYLLAHLHYQFWNAGIRLDEEDLERARGYADKALTLDPRSPDHLVIRGLLEVTGGNGVRGYRYMEAALEQDPHHPDALFWSPGISAFFGREVEPKRRLEQLKLVDPLNPFSTVFLVWIELKQGRFKSALGMADRFRKTSPFEPLLEGVFALALAHSGRQHEAVSVIHAVFGPRSDMIARGFRALAAAFEGDRDAVIDLVDSDFERWAEKDFQYAEWAAQALALVQDIDRALDWLEISIKRGNINYPFLSSKDSFLESVRGEARFGALMEQVKREWEAFEP